MITSRSEFPVLAVRGGGHFCVIPLPQVMEVMRPLRATPVVDLAGVWGRAGDERPEPAAAARWVALRVRDRMVALAVEAVLAIRSLDAARFTALPPLWQGPHSPAVAALGALDRELFIVLETARLLPDADKLSGGEVPA